MDIYKYLYKDIEKIKIKKCTIECYNCNKKSFTDFLEIDNERLDKNYKDHEKYDLHYDYYDYDYKDQDIQHYVVNYINECTIHEKKYFPSYDLEYKCENCNSFDTEIFSFTTRS